MTTTISVCGLSTGSEDKDVAHIRNISLEFEHETTTLRELITRTVTAQVQKVNQVSGLTGGEKQTIIRQRYIDTKDSDLSMSNETIATKTSQTAPQSLKVDAEIEKALYGFERQYYMVIVNGCQIMALDEKVLLTKHSEVVFLRLMPLAGG